MYWLRLRNNNHAYLNVSVWLSSLWGTKFLKPTAEMSKDELNACPKCFYTTKSDGWVQINAGSAWSNLK